MLKLLIFSFSEAVTSLWRSRVLNILSVGTVMFAMFILGSFIFVAQNLNKITLDWQDQIQFNVFLRDDASEAQRGEIEAVINQAFFVDKAVFISKEEAKQRFDRDFTDYGEVLEGMENNPFPASFQVTLVKGVGRDSFDELKGRLSLLQGIEEVYYDEEIYRRLDFFANLIQLAGWFFGSIMIFSSIFTISNVLKLTFFTRREEVDIMKLVGASRSYIRGPFIIEGILIGLLGSLLGVTMVLVGYLLLQGYLEGKDFILSNLHLVFLSKRWVSVLILSGAFSGLLGSLISLNQFLEEHISYQ